MQNFKWCPSVTLALVVNSGLCYVFDCLQGFQHLFWQRCRLTHFLGARWDPRPRTVTRRDRALTVTRAKTRLKQQETCAPSESALAGECLCMHKRRTRSSRAISSDLAMPHPSLNSVLLSNIFDSAMVQKSPKGLPTTDKHFSCFLAPLQQHLMIS